MTNFEKVGLFMTTFGQEVKKKPSLSTDKINNLRTPFSNWGGWKKDVKLKERLIVAFILQIPLFIILVIL